MSIELLYLLLPVSVPSSNYMHQALDGTPLAADRPFIPTVQVPPASFTLKSSIILTRLDDQNADRRFVLSSV